MITEAMWRAFEAMIARIAADPDALGRDRRPLRRAVGAKRPALKRGR